MNNGLLDTFKPKIKSPNTVKNDASYSTGSLNEDYKDTISAYNTFIKELGSKNTVTQPNYNTEAITNFIQTAVSLTEYDQAAQTIADNLNISKDKAATTTKDEIEAQTNDNLSSSPNSGFLPFNLSITMDGLSGMKIFQKYKADVEFLPKNYPTSLEFIINGISNTIQNNEWTTTLDSFAIPKNPYGAKPSKKLTSKKINNPNSSEGPTQVFSTFYEGSTQLSTVDTIVFLTDVLKGIGISNPNSYQIQFMKSWRQKEGGKSAFNPFNSTLTRNGSLPNNYNFGYPVQNYTSRAQGLEATISTIKESQYSSLISSIKNIKNETDIDKSMIVLNNSQWGTKFSPANSRSYRTLNNLLYGGTLVKKNN
jgi:hypothetical protein